jgi:hypothetical protein
LQVGTKLPTPASFNYSVQAPNTSTVNGPKYTPPPITNSQSGLSSPHIMTPGDQLSRLNPVPNTSTRQGAVYTPSSNQGFGAISSLIPQSTASSNPVSFHDTSSNPISKSHTDWLSQQTQDMGNMAKSVSNAIVPQAYASESPPPRKTFDTNAHPNAVSTPGFVQGTPDWIQNTIQKAAEKYNIPTMLLSALLKQESGFNPNAKSPAGAEGIAQFMPATAKGMGVNPYDPESAIMGAAKYLRQSWDQFGKPELALAAYNAGGGAVNQYGGIPPYKETQNYVKSVMEMAGDLHQSANGPYLDTLKEIKKNAPKVLGASTPKSSQSFQSPYNFPISMPSVSSNIKSPIPSGADLAITRIRKYLPQVKLNDQKIREFYSKYGESLIPNTVPSL